MNRLLLATLRQRAAADVRSLLRKMEPHISQPLLTLFRDLLMAAKHRIPRLRQLAF